MSQEQPEQQQTAFEGWPEETAPHAQFAEAQRQEKWRSAKAQRADIEEE